MSIHTVNRQPEGIPTGGQFAATTHAEPDLSLSDPSIKNVTEFFEERDSIRARRERLQSQQENMDRLSQAYSIRGAGALAMARFPGAAAMKIAANEDGENQYDVVAILDKDGNVLQHVDDDEDFIYEEMVQDGPNLQDLILDLNLKDDSWADNGIAIVAGDGKRVFKSAFINLTAARDAPVPFIAAENSPYTRSFSEDEQRDLVEAANRGIVAIEDVLDDPGSFDEHRQFQELEDLKDRVNALLTVTKENRA
ncbi:hypothetical protein IV500_05300 [Paeniglutamicibacter antarcticus]|uniref:Uncharacterized protein n=1 Tax=Arthrobacter terrae TaxID=2935737 RepID=A0A931G3M6_9MICC|nr:hypothetical protein [Arthrobacter terrae]MBG0738836.1 hypothetical protein [Arthrobacter terrae]